MLLKNLELNNFARFSHASIDLQKYNKALIVGIINNETGDSNGSGKTSLIDSIGWCVWGESKAKAIDENVKLGTSICSVSLEFEHDGKECSITRTRDKGRSLSTVNFYINGVLSNGKTVLDTNKKIVSFLRLDYSTYVNSVYLRQDDIFSFADNGTNKEGRDILEKVLGLEEYDLYHEEAKANVKRITRDIELIEISIDSNTDIDSKIQNTKTILESRQNEHDQTSTTLSSKQAQIESAKQIVAALNLKKEELQRVQFGIRELEIIVESSKNEVNSLIRKFNTDTETIKIKTQELQAVVNALPEILARLASHTTAIVENEKIKNQVEKVDEQLAAEKKNSYHAAEKLVNIGSDVKSLDRKIGELKEELRLKTLRMNNGPDSTDVCSECLTIITPDTVDHFKKHLDTEIKGLIAKTDELTKSLQDKNSAKDSMWAEVDKTNKSISSLETNKSTMLKTLLSDSQISERANNLKREQDMCAKAKQDLDLINKSTQLNELKAEIDTKKTSYLSKKAEMESMQAATPKTQFDDGAIRSAELEVKTLGNELDAIKQTIYILVAEIKNGKAALENFGIIKKEIDQQRSSIDEKKGDLSIFMRLQEAFSSKGIRADIIQNAIAELEKHSNDLLGRLTSGRLSVEFVTKKEVKASRGEQVEKVVFEVVVNDGGDALPFHLYSGGEKFRVAFVLRVALAQLLQRRANSKLEFLIIDEAFSPLDKNGIEKNIAVIDELQNEFKTILVITHRDDIKQYFDEVITVSRDLTGSKIL